MSGDNRLGNGEFPDSVAATALAPGKGTEANGGYPPDSGAPNNTYPGLAPYVGDPPPGLAPWVGDPPPGAATDPFAPAPAPSPAPAVLHSTPDRVSYSLGLKVNLGNYESLDLHESFSSDVLPGETREQALGRAAAFVEGTIRARAKKLREELRNK